MAILFATTCEHYITVADRFHGGSGLSTITDPTPRARGRVIELVTTSFGLDYTTYQATHGPGYVSDGGYPLVGAAANIYLDTGGTPSAVLDFRVGSATSAVKLTFTEDSVAISLDSGTPTSHAIALPADTWTHISALVWLNGAGASWVLIQTGLTAAILAGGSYEVDIRNATFGGGATKFTSYRWSGASAYGDDFMTSDGDFILAAEGYCCVPTADGFEVEDASDPGAIGRWEASTGATLWNLVDETPTPSTTDYMRADGYDYQQYLQTNASSVVPTTVNSLPAAVYVVNPVALVKGSTAQPDIFDPGFDPVDHTEWREVAASVYADGTSSGSAATMPGTSYGFLDAPDALTPASNPWTRALAVAAQTGVHANASSGVGDHQVPYTNDIYAAQCILEVYVYAGAAAQRRQHLVFVA